MITITRSATIAFTVLPLLLIAACGNDGTSQPRDPQSAVRMTETRTTPQPALNPDAPAMKLPAGVEISVTTPATRARNGLPAIAEKTVSLTRFQRTLESTYLRVHVKLPSTEADGTLKLMQAGDVLRIARADASEKSGAGEFDLNFYTPQLTKDERAAGFARVNYELVLSSGSGADSLRIPFSLTIYDQYQPSDVVPDSGECLIYHTPERASGCYQNRTRTTQEIVFNDSITQSHETDVDFSGGISIPISIVSLSFGADRTTVNGTEVSQGSEIHFTNCILCSSIIYRQEVESIRKGQVYRVMVDGSLVLAGTTTVTSTKVAYEYTSTGSESEDYNCDIPSRLPVGYSPGCAK